MNLQFSKFYIRVPMMSAQECADITRSILTAFDARSIYSHNIYSAIENGIADFRVLFVFKNDSFVEQFVDDSFSSGRNSKYFIESIFALCGVRSITEKMAAIKLSLPMEVYLTSNYKEFYDSLLNLKS